MLFYASLILFWLVLSFIALWIFRALRHVGTAVYQAFLPSSKEKLHVDRLTRLEGSLDSLAIPWGWPHAIQAIDTPATAPVVEKKPITLRTLVPWGWPGSKHNLVLVTPRNILKNTGKELLPDPAATPAPVEDNWESEQQKSPANNWLSPAEKVELSGKNLSFAANDRVGRFYSGQVVRPWGW